MKEFDSLRESCEIIEEITAHLIDEFLVYYLGEKENIARKFDSRMAAYKHVGKEYPAWIRMLKSQYIAHRIFCKDGLLRKYLNDVEVKRRAPVEIHYLEEQILVPWRFSFAVISENPAPDFYQMEDVFTGESFLLYSKSVTVMLTEQRAVLWFNLIRFNGSCWQTYGPLAAYQCFDADDIYFYATELNPAIDDEESLMLEVEKNPVPFMMLWPGGQIPTTFHKDDELLLLFSEEELSLREPAKFPDTFRVEFNKNVWRLALRKFESFPHHAASYYHERKNQLVITAMTEKGFNAMVEALNDNGMAISKDPAIRIHPSMLDTAESVLKKKIDLNPYEKLFPRSTPEEDDGLKGINKFMESILPILNSGGVPDIDALARQADISPENARRFVEIAMAKMDEIRKGTGKR